MINEKLIKPKSIVVVGGSDNTQSPGGKVLKNLIEHKFNGQLLVVNPKKDEIQGIKTFNDPRKLPNVDLAIIAIAAKFCKETIEILANQKNTQAFIILSAGFSEENEEGAKLEKEIVEIVDKVNGSLIGPNCIGIFNQFHSSVFTTPIPKIDPNGVDFISGSGATAVFIIEAAMPKGLTFSSVYSVGNSAQLGVEEILKQMDEEFNSETSSKVKLLYIESIDKPQMLLKHASSLIKKGCKIAAIKAGGSEAGSRAASSHTGALASSDTAVNSLFRKAGIIRCYGREELTTVASIFMHKELQGKNIAIITHAGGPAVMLTDSLSNGGLNIPHIEGKKADELLEKLYPGSSVANPIDFLATGNAEQLGHIIDACDNDFDNIDAMVVIFGSPGLFPVYDVYDLLDEKMKSSKKPIFPVLPSIINVKDEINHFLSKGRITFPDEVNFGNALCKIINTPKTHELTQLTKIDKQKIRSIIDNANNGYLSPVEVQELLDASGIPRAGEAVAKTKEEAILKAIKLGFPIVMKVIGPVHKSDVGGVVLNIDSKEKVAEEFKRMIKIKDTTSVLMQPMLSGTELFVGAKMEEKFGHLIFCGLGGIFIEVLKDVNAGLSPLSEKEVNWMIKNLKGYGIIEGARGQEGINQQIFNEIIVRVSALVQTAPEIFEMDINPLLGKKDKVVAVDARIRIEK
ncbi:MAG: acetate--CoA ligase family protein [Bacteroidota bacterium]|nr:acetate--CoA ligase family protein [Bacteroidota bacterium]